MAVSKLLWGQTLVNLLIVLVYVRGDYVVVVRVDGYVNPTNSGQFRGPDRCCDNNPDNSGSCSGNRRCDNRFTFCLKSPDNTDDGTSTCMSPVLTSTQTNTNGAPIDFTQPTWLGLDNPLMLSGISTAWEGAQLYIEVNDVDRSNRQLVDVWPLVGNPTDFPVGANLSSPANFTGIYDYATLTLGFQIVCAEFYYGTVCENLNECLSQSINCNQGVCVDGDGAGACTCNPGYTGQFCDELVDYCLNINCGGNGQCGNLANSFRCNCTPGFTGDLCDLTDHCEGVNCSGNGDCINELSTYSCNCTPGFTDRDCETDIDDCVGVTCNGRGNCTDLVNDYLCTCDPGYTDRDCETDINECVGQNCSGNGQCVDGENNFTCLCQPGFTGDLCSVEIQEQSMESVSGGAIAGGVVGGLVGVVLLAVTVVLIVVLVNNRQRSLKYDVTMATVSEGLPGDNPVYGVCEVEPTDPRSHSANDANGIVSSLPDHDFDNPLYGFPESAPMPRGGSRNIGEGGLDIGW